MRRLATDDATQGDITVIAAASADQFHGLDIHPDRSRDFKGTRYFQTIIGRAGGVKRGRGTLSQLVRDLPVVWCFDDK